MPMRSSSVALRRRHLGRPRAAPSLTPAAWATDPPVTTVIFRRELSLLRELERVEAKVDKSRRLYDRFSRRIFPAVVVVLLLFEYDQDISIRELKESVAKLKEEKEKAASATMASASSSAMPAASEPDLNVAMLKEEKSASAATVSSSATPAASEVEPEPTIANGVEGST